MPRHAMFFCTCARTSCYPMPSWLALAYICPAMPCYVLPRLQTYVVLRDAMFSRRCTHTSSYSVLSSLALAHICHPTRCYPLLHLQTYIMPRSGFFLGTIPTLPWVICPLRFFQTIAESLPAFVGIKYILLRCPPNVFFVYALRAASLLIPFLLFLGPSPPGGCAPAVFFENLSCRLVLGSG